MESRRLKRYLEDPNFSIPKRTLSCYRRSTPLQEDENDYSSYSDGDNTLQQIEEDCGAIDKSQEYTIATDESHESCATASSGRKHIIYRVFFCYS